MKLLQNVQHHYFETQCILDVHVRIDIIQQYDDDSDSDYLGYLPNSSIDLFDV